jgi:hypothetical protein
MAWLTIKRAIEFTSNTVEKPATKIKEPTIDTERADHRSIKFPLIRLPMREDTAKADITNPRNFTPNP